MCVCVCVCFSSCEYLYPFDCFMCISLSCREAVCSTQQLAAEQGLSIGPEVTVVQLRPPGHVERRLPDGWATERSLTFLHVCKHSSLNTSFSLFSSGSELPDTRRADGPQPGPLPAQWLLRICAQTWLPVSPKVQLWPWKHRRRTRTYTHTAYHTG